MHNRLTPIRRLLLAGVLPLAGLAVACTPAPTCPSIAQGAWSGSWNSIDFPGAGGGVSAEIHTSGSTMTGSASLTGSALSGGALHGTIACNRVTVTVGYGIEIDGTVSPDGKHLSGEYTTSVSPLDHGAISLDAGSLSAS